MTDQMLSNEIKKIPDHIFYFIENELQLYRAYKQAITELEADLEDLINRSALVPFDEIRARNGPTDIINLTIIRSLVIEEKIKEKLSHVRKIEAGLKVMSDEEILIIEKRYFSEQYTNDQMMDVLHLARNKYYKIRDGIIHKYAIVFGLA